MQSDQIQHNLNDYKPFTINYADSYRSTDGYAPGELGIGRGGKQYRWCRAVNTTSSDIIIPAGVLLTEVQSSLSVTKIEQEEDGLVKLTVASTTVEDNFQYSTLTVTNGNSEGLVIPILKVDKTPPTAFTGTITSSTVFSNKPGPATTIYAHVNINLDASVLTATGVLGVTRFIDVKLATTDLVVGVNLQRLVIPKKPTNSTRAVLYFFAQIVGEAYLKKTAASSGKAIAKGDEVVTDGTVGAVTKVGTTSVNSVGEALEAASTTATRVRTRVDISAGLL